ncbi:hypothetical protein F6X40_12595 [Paraburkholderia sp. UCT31]|uniref:hypothetical protein n=1 Tax=Paraburkholderia sp. UCT31 TaxID=2615209 RepID=UPI00165523CB|nr:hypothetical protein [Paraburkholderia sp. UCT31]MBC8737637.1 hypothetical protein [Paraburkholderia sp. UCT31]
MNKATSTLIAAVAALTLSGSVYAQSNNTLATPTTQSPAAATSGYGTPGATNTDSGGSGSPTSGQPNSANSSSTSRPPAYGVNNSLATPTTKSPAGQ